MTLTEQSHHRLIAIESDEQSNQAKDVIESVPSKLDNEVIENVTSFDKNGSKQQEETEINRLASIESDEQSNEAKDVIESEPSKLDYEVIENVTSFDKNSSDQQEETEIK